MGAEVFWILETSINDGKTDEFQTLMEEMVSGTKANEPGTVNYEWYKDGASVRIFERFADSDAALAHLGNFGASFAERFMGAVEVTGLTVYGDINDDLRGAVSGLDAVCLGSWGGFSR